MKIDEERMLLVVKVLQWYEDNGRNYTKAAKEFKLDRKTVMSWHRKFDLDKLSLEYNLVREVGTTRTTVERVVPPDVKIEAEKILRNMTNIGAKATMILELWVDDMAERAVNSIEGVKVIKPYEMDRLQRLSKDFAPYIIPDKTQTESTTINAYAQLKQRLADNKRINNQQTKEIDGEQE